MSVLCSRFPVSMSDHARPQMLKMLRSQPHRPYERNRGGDLPLFPGRAVREPAMHIIWVIVIGFVAGIIARLLAPGPNNPTGFILTTVIGIIGAFLATFIGQAIGWYRADQGAGLIGATVGAIIVLFIWHLVAGKGYADGPGGPGPRRWL